MPDATPSALTPPAPDGSTEGARSPYPLLLAILGAGLLYRIIYLRELSHLPDWYRLIGDERYFMDQARHFGEPGPCQPFHMSPLFIAGLHAFLSVFGEDPLRWRLMMMAIGVTGALLTCGVARRLLGASSGAWALGLYLFCGPLLYYESNLDLCTLASTTTLGALYGAVRWQPHGDLRAWAAAGLCLGLSILARPNAALLLLVLAAAPFLLHPDWSRVRRLGHAALAPLLALLVTVPATVHNLRCDPDPVWISDSGGLNLYIGNHQQANGTFNIPPRVPQAADVDSQQAAFIDAAARALGQSRLSPARASAYWSRAALREIAAAPGRWLRLLTRKALLVWNNQDLSNTRSYEFRSEICAALGPWLVQVGYLSPLALLGLLVAVRRWRRYYFLAAFTLAFSFALTLFFVLGHYRQVLLPLFILLAVLSAQTLQRLWLADDPRWRRRLLLVLLPVAGLALLFNRPLLDVSSRADDAFKHAYALHISGDLPGAERWYLESLQETRTLPAARNLALLYTRSGRRDDALRLWALVQSLALQEGLPDAQAEAERYRGVLSRTGEIKPESKDDLR